jgi:hypothetical protein
MIAAPSSWPASGASAEHAATQRLRCLAAALSTRLVPACAVARDRRARQYPDQPKAAEMNTQPKRQYVLEEFRVSVNVKLASLWTSFMFFYIYVDYFHLYMPGSISEIIDGRVFLFEINQGFVLASLVSVAIPALMICLSISLPPKVNRWANLSVATIYIPYTLFNLVGEAWVHMVFGAVVEVALLLLIVRHAWTWPRIEKPH